MQGSSTKRLDARRPIVLILSHQLVFLGLSFSNNNSLTTMAGRRNTNFNLIAFFCKKKTFIEILKFILKLFFSLGDYADE
jgi:hypothetical protein